MNIKIYSTEEDPTPYCDVLVQKRYVSGVPKYRRES